MPLYVRYFFVALILLPASALFGQPVTGIWRGKVQRGLTTYKVETKLVRKGDSLTGTSYYYASPGHFMRYSIKGYMDAVDGSLHWWDEQLIESRGRQVSLLGNKQPPFTSEADINCPGSGVMLLQGKSGSPANNDLMGLELRKEDDAVFEDDWNELIAQWHTGGAHPDWIAQAEASQQPAPLVVAVPKEPAPAPVVAAPPAPMPKPQPKPEPAVVQAAPPNKLPPAPVQVLAPKPQSLQEKFTLRQRTTQAVLPVAGDSIELQFYDNAEIDGDSIALFLNGRLLFEHVRLSAEPFVMRLAVADLPPEAELSMVAENLGAIPPNTSFMLAYINGERHTARLESTEKTTAVIILRRPSIP